jgi:hypothetical protein
MNEQREPEKGQAGTEQQPGQVVITHPGLDADEVRELVRQELQEQARRHGLTGAVS